MGPLGPYTLTDHAREEMARRGLPLEVVDSVLSQPEQILPLREGRVIAQGRVAVGGQEYLVRVFVDVDRTPAAVVTAYRTSKIEKYWEAP